MEITEDQLVRLMIGAAKAHATVLNAVLDAEAVNRRAFPALQAAAQLQGPLDLDNMFARLYLQMLANPAKDASAQREYFAQELQRLLSKDG